MYIGALFRYGISSLTNVSTSEVGNYQIFTFPGIRGGLKYNFSNKLGFRISLGLENIIVERIVRSNEDGVLPDRANYTEGKIAASISRFF